jgi:tetratricopeptide (TPR) repeat protein
MAINVLLRRGQFDAAERHAARVRASASVRPLQAGLPVIRAVLLPAETALRRGDVATTLATLRSLESATLFAQPQPLLVTIELFWFYLRMGRISDAERMLDRITPLRDSHLYGALLAYFSGDSSRLRRELAGAMVDRPDGDGQWPVVAWLQVQTGDLADARRSNERATAPTRASTSGHILLAERRYDEAIKALSSDVRALGPGMYWRSLIGLTQAWAAKGDHTRAATTLGTLEDSEATFTPMNHPVFRAQAYLTLAEAHLQLGRPASARRILDHLRGTLAASEPRSVLKQRLEVLTARLDGP